jgi:hypothetical protein
MRSDERTMFECGHGTKFMRPERRTRLVSVGENDRTAGHIPNSETDNDRSS